jgi:uncharacterized protein YkwD/LysM repeat protein
MKNKARLCLFLGCLLLMVWSIAPPDSANALPQLPRETITSPAQLIGVVNDLRASYGLAALETHSALMQAAQSQADYMAATGQITHSRPGGITFTQQLLNLGFPLAGQLSAGGLRSENILNSSNPLVWNGVPSVWQDSAHMATMISASYTHIGAGVSQGAGGYYYALDCAAATGSGQMQTQVVAALTSSPSSAGSAISQYIVPMVVSTAQPDGNVYHVLQYGQTLWNVAIDYGTTIKELQALNNLGDDLLVWQGQKLLVKQGATQPASAVPSQPMPDTATPMMGSTPTAVVVSSPTVPTAEITRTPVVVEEAPASNSSSSKLLIGILIMAALVGGGVAVWLIRDPN